MKVLPNFENWHVEIDGALFQLLQNADARAMLRVILINTYLTNQPTKTMGSLREPQGKLGSPELPNLSALFAAIPFLALVA